MKYRWRLARHPHYFTIIYVPKMITLPNKDFKSSNIMLQQIINSTTKVKMLKVCKKFDLYVSPNLRKDETSRRVA